MLCGAVAVLFVKLKKPQAEGLRLEDNEVTGAA
jgi:hypothetical protein